MAEEARSEPFEQLEQRVNRRVQEALSGLQQEIRDRLKRAGDHLVGELDRELGDVASELPTSFLPREELDPLTAEAEDAGRRQLLGHLLAALSAVDRATSQRGVLDAVLTEGRRFADRTAVLLAREDGLTLWAAEGWADGGDGDGAHGVVLPWGAGGAWAPEGVGSGTVALAGNDCAPLCSRLDAALPDGGVLIPLILRDRLAAVLYADHGGGAFFAEALQALAWSAALALEALPFRNREATPTLHWSGSDTAAAGSATWMAPAAPAGSAGGEDESDGSDEAAVDERGADVVEVVEESEETLLVEEVATFDLADEPLLAEDSAVLLEVADETDEETEVEVVEDYGETEDAGYELRIEDEEPDAAADDLDATADLDDDDDDALSREDSQPSSDVGELEISAPGAADDEGMPEPPTWDAPSLDAEPAPASDLGDDSEGDLYDADAAPAVADAEAAPRIAGFERARTAPAAGEEEGEGAAEAGAEPLPVETAAVPAAPSAAAAAGDSAEVAPPTDHSGPGLAFAGAAGAGAAGGDEGRHEEARRLARLLVSEIRLYNEDLVDEGRRNNDIYQRLREDIDRSRQIYEERIDAGIRDSTDYFYEELVRNLGGGDAGALGI